MYSEESQFFKTLTFFETSSSLVKHYIFILGFLNQF